MSLEEPLSILAPLAAETAQRHCCRLDDTGAACDWYHGTIDYLRLLDLVISPADHAGFYVPILERLAREPAFGSVLVSGAGRSEEHTSELQSLMRISYAVFCLKK